MANLSSALPSDPRWKRAVDLPQIASESASPSLHVPAINHLLINGLTRGTLVETSGRPLLGKDLALHAYFGSRHPKRRGLCRRRFRQ